MTVYLTWLDKMVLSKHCRRHPIYSDELVQFRPAVERWVADQCKAHGLRPGLKQLYWLYTVGTMLAFRDHSKPTPESDTIEDYEALVSLFLLLLPFLDVDRALYHRLFTSPSRFNYLPPVGIKLGAEIIDQFANHPPAFDVSNELSEAVYYVDCQRPIGNVMLEAIFAGPVVAERASQEKPTACAIFRRGDGDFRLSWPLSASLAGTPPEVSDLPDHLRTLDLPGLMKTCENLIYNAVIYRTAAKNSVIEREYLPRLGAADLKPKALKKQRSLKTLFAIERLERYIYKAGNQGPATSRGSGRAKPDYRVEVAMHPRSQPCGPGRQDHKLIMIRAHQRYLDKPVKPKLGILRRSALKPSSPS